jgi:hypothetical protein
MNDYQAQVLANKVKLAKDLSELSGRRRYVMDSSDSDYRQVKLAGDLPIIASYASYQKTYNFFLDHHYPYVRFDTQKAEVDKIGKPQEIHKLDGRRINQWVDHLTKLDGILKAVSQDRTAKVNDFIAQVKQLGGSIPKLDPHYHTGSGEIIKNGIQFKYEITNEGYISRRIDVYYQVNHTLADFTALASNQWSKSE